VRTIYVTPRPLHYAVTVQSFLYESATVRWTIRQTVTAFMPWTCRLTQCNL